MSKGLPGTLPKCTTGGEKVSDNKLQCQKVYLAALPKWKTGGEKVSGYKLQCQKFTWQLYLNRQQVGRR